MIYVPKDVKQCLIRDEIVDKQFDLKDIGALRVRLRIPENHIETVRAMPRSWTKRSSYRSDCTSIIEKRRVS